MEAFYICSDVILHCARMSHISGCSIAHVPTHWIPVDPIRHCDNQNCLQRFPNVSSGAANSSTESHCFIIKTWLLLLKWSSIIFSCGYPSSFLDLGIISSQHLILGLALLTKDFLASFIFLSLLASLCQHMDRIFYVQSYLNTNKTVTVQIKLCIPKLYLFMLLSQFFRL